MAVLFLIILILMRYWIGAAMAIVGFIGLWLVSGLAGGLFCGSHSALYQS